MNTLPKANWKKAVFYILVILLVFIELFPIFLVVMTSFKTKMNIWASASPFAEFTPTLKNYKEVLFNRPFLVYMKNSFIIAVFTTIISVSLGALASYGFARYRFKGDQTLSIGVLASRMIPPITLAVPFFLLMRQIKLLDTYFALIMAHITFILPYVIWLSIPFFKSIPESYEEAALIDGCTRFQSFIRIFLPLVAPGLVVSAIFSFIFSWNDFLYALVLSSSEVKTAPVAINGFIGNYEIRWGIMTAAGTIVIIPVFIFALSLQKYIINGLSFGGID